MERVSLCRELHPEHRMSLLAPLSPAKSDQPAHVKRIIDDRRDHAVRFLPELVKATSHRPRDSCDTRGHRVADLTRLECVVEKHQVPTEPVYSVGMLDRRDGSPLDFRFEWRRV
jgi:hypothetical protein